MQVSAVICIETAEAWTKLQQAVTADAALDLSLPEGKQTAGLRGTHGPTLGKCFHDC